VAGSSCAAGSVAGKPLAEPGHKPISHSSDELQLRDIIETNDQRIEAIARHVSADHELLGAIDLVLEPSPTPRPDS
jgi:hypothetical protein